LAGGGRCCLVDGFHRLLIDPGEAVRAKASRRGICGCDVHPTRHGGTGWGLHTEVVRWHLATAH
jgi:hypothetical protein